MPRTTDSGLNIAGSTSGSSTESSQWIDRRASDKATRAAKARHASGRRRHVDPTTCERDYSREEIEFMNAMNIYKKSSGRAFPTWSEVLEVLRSLGYEKQTILGESLDEDQADPSSV